MKKLIAGIFVVVLVIAACTPEAVSFPKGQYLEEEFDTIISFEDGDKYTVKRIDGIFLIEDGQYTVDGDIITIVENEICPSLEGVYRWSVGENGHLQFELIEENCELRLLDSMIPLP